MKVLKISLLPVICSLLFACNKSPDASDKTLEPQDVIETLYDFDDGSIPSELVFYQAAGKIISPENPQLLVNFDSKEHPHSQITFQPKTPWDWSEHADFNLAFDFTNSGQQSVQLYLDISDIDGANYTRTISVPVGGNKRTYYAVMASEALASADDSDSNELNFKSGLRSDPPTWRSDDVLFVSMWGKKNLNLKGITKIAFSVQSALFDKEVTIDNVRLRKNPSLDSSYLTKIVDQYGQNATIEFPGKIHSDEELLAIKQAELKQLTGQSMADRSAFGGWKNGPKLAATGYFRTEKVDGKWSLVDPEGYLYFATGLDIIRLANSTTMTGYDFNQEQIANANKNDVTPEDSQGLNRVPDSVVGSRHVTSELRKDLFNWLPTYDEPLGKHYGYRRSAHSGPLDRGETYSFYSANLERKYGANGQDYMAKWREVTVDRMLNWGFTSLGNWTDPSYYDVNRIPYFANGWIRGNFKTISSGNDFWGALPDVFDPVFEERAMVTAQVVSQEVKNNPWCVGVFIDNEKSFGRPETPQSRYGIVINTLKRDGNEVPTKAEFTRLMKAKYSDINNLNQAWNKSIASWDAFQQGVDSSLQTDTQADDYSQLLAAYADKYFNIVEKSLTKYMPNHMYLGARFPDWGMPLEVVKASAKYTDVISFNSYKEGLPSKKWEFLKEIDKPAIIGEFHIGASDSGLYHPGLIHAANQKDRAQMYKNYMFSVIDNPYFIGAHWFQYIDSPITGRAYDGENYNVGFIAVTDTPYQEMVDAAKDIHTQLYERRFKEQ
ncbi:MAG: beta-galactosidase [Thalassotalea sp.]